MRNLKLVIEYNGCHFYGWQKQEDKRTVQGELEKALSSLLNETVCVEGSGRTDRGVHALGQVASCKTESTIPLKNIKGALNNLLPSDVRILKVTEENENFHARFSAKKKTYKYVVQVTGDRPALKSDFVAYYPFDVDLEKMREASKILIGKHNFKGFCCADTTVADFEREIYDISIFKRNKIFTFYVTGNGFLYNMVRIIVGTLLDCGRGKLSFEDITLALVNGNRSLAGKTMPACGLYLKSVEYPADKA